MVSLAETDIISRAVTASLARQSGGLELVDIRNIPQQGCSGGVVITVDPQGNTSISEHQTCGQLAALRNAIGGPVGQRCAQDGCFTWSIRYDGGVPNQPVFTNSGTAETGITGSGTTVQINLLPSQVRDIDPQEIFTLLLPASVAALLVVIGTKIKKK